MMKSVIFFAIVVLTASGTASDSSQKRRLSVGQDHIVYGPETTEMRCRFNDLDDEDGQKCVLQIGTISADGGDTARLAFRWLGANGEIAVFVGTRGFADEWRFGELNSRPAAAYGINRRHHVFSTSDYQNRFECWYEGWK
jgi:hypothetical protein